MVHEEVGELVIELGKLLVVLNKPHRGKVELESILEEVVDVEIMLEQLTVILSVFSEDGHIECLLDRKQAIRETKLSRLETVLLPPQ